MDDSECYNYQFRKEVLSLTIAPLIYKALKIIEEGKEPTAQSLEVEQNDFHAAMERIESSGYATNINFSRGGRGSEILIVFANGSKLTDEGRAFIEEYEREPK